MRRTRQQHFLSVFVVCEETINGSSGMFNWVSLGRAVCLPTRCGRLPARHFGWLGSHRTFGYEHPDGSSNDVAQRATRSSRWRQPGQRYCLRAGGFPKDLHEIPELIRLANKAVDLRRAHRRRQHLLAVGAGQDHSYIRSRLARLQQRLHGWKRPGMVMSSRITSILRPFARRRSMAASHRQLPVPRSPSCAASSRQLAEVDLHLPQPTR